MSNNIFLEESNTVSTFSLKGLLSSSRDINYQDNLGWSLLFELVKTHQNHNLKTALGLKANVNLRDKKGRNALYWAIESRNMEAVRILIEANIDIYVTPTLSAMHYAVYKDDVKTLKTLKNCKIDINFFDEINATPLIYAVLYNKSHCINYLLNNNADVNQRDVLGNSAISLAKDLNIDSFLSKLK